MSTITMESVMNLNNTAVALLANGKSVQALITFRSAIDSLRSIMESERVIVINSAPAAADSSTAIIIEDFNPQALTRLPIGTKEAEFSPHNKFSFYCRVLNVNNTSLISSSQPDENDAFLSMTILFNMAVTCHMIGLENRKDALLQTALTFYNMLLSVVENMRDSAGPVYQNLAKIILMATLSNTGHIYSHLCMSNEAEICRGLLTSFLSDSPQTRYSMDTDEYMTFYLNTTSFGTTVTRGWSPAA